MYVITVIIISAALSLLVNHEEDPGAGWTPVFEREGSKPVRGT